MPLPLLSLPEEEVHAFFKTETMARRALTLLSFNPLHESA